MEHMNKTPEATLEDFVRRHAVDGAVTFRNVSITYACSDPEFPPGLLRVEVVTTVKEERLLLPPRFINRCETGFLDRVSEAIRKVFPPKLRGASGVILVDDANPQ